jgi:ketosteroid isomerase-like protein
VTDGPPDGPRADARADALRAAEEALRRAQLAGDVAALERLVDDALLFTGPDGLLYGKGDDLAAHREGWVRITRLEPSEERVQRLGDVAVVSVRMEMAGAFRGAAFAGPFRYTRVWRDGPGGWRVVAGHVSAVQEAIGSG